MWLGQVEWQPTRKGVVRMPMAVDTQQQALRIEAQEFASVARKTIEEQIEYMKLNILLQFDLLVY